MFKIQSVTFLVAVVFFFFWVEGGGGGASCQKVLPDEGGHARKVRVVGGAIQFPNYSAPNPTSPSYPIKNEPLAKILIILAQSVFLFAIFKFS